MTGENTDVLLLFILLILLFCAYHIFRISQHIDYIKEKFEKSKFYIRTDESIKDNSI